MRYTFENRSYFNGLTFALYSFYFGFLLVLPIFVATEGAAQIAGDTSSGSIYLLLTRPVSRARSDLFHPAVRASDPTVPTGQSRLVQLGALRQSPDSLSAMSTIR